ncbi:response regulator [Paenibacillus agricola]|uniref:Response regulator n=1 Tax=Paenibacillus agricola TaxID=2716264 RepID=A0ABX0JEM8_9BACL|nr:response regulator [Paenibacillus agricola]NHN34904.1 response regulator [Paenibacillus agricola]
MWRIVIIDDDRKVLRGMKKIIPWVELKAELAGEAENGSDGLELIRSIRPDIVITDIYMPVMNGLEMLQQLRKEDIKSKMIILSGYTDFEYARQSLSLNVSDYLVKPVSVPTLLEVLRKVIQELEKEEKEQQELQGLLQTSDSYRPTMEKEYLKSLVTGAFEPHFRRMQETNANYFAENKFQILAVEIEDTKRSSEVSSSDIHLFRYAVANIVEELLQTKWPESSVLELYSRHVAILLRYPPNKDTMELSELCQLLIDNVLRFLDVSIRIGIGSVQHGIKNIANSTEEALSALVSMRSFILEETGVKVWENAKYNSQTSSVKFPRVKYYQEVADAIRQLQEERAIQLVKEFAVQWMHSKETGSEDVQRVAAELWAIFAFALNEAGYSLDELYLDAAVKMEIGTLQTPNHFVEWIDEKIRGICERLDSNGQNVKHKQAIDFIIQYIHEHYFEEIRLGDMADKVYLSRNYLSNLFRTAVGETFQDYITKVRMDKAKRLIMEGKHRIYEVAEKVGYRNVPYFTSMFKRQTGRNPTDLLKEPIPTKKQE